ncbi:MAG: hypothetical protein U1E05_27570, partial [Patescibacteria group bacterium]|nr:hypothetical protein [Patescibacteria group bacterium]
MCNEPRCDKRELEALEACRPGSDDCALPELGLKQLLENDPSLRDVQRRIELADVQIAAALHQVPVPEGLEANILDVLATARHPNMAPSRRVHRRRWLVSGG